MFKTTDDIVFQKLSKYFTGLPEKTWNLTILVLKNLEFEKF